MKKLDVTSRIMSATSFMDGPLPGEKGTLAEDKVETPQLRRRIRINMEDEEVIRQLPGMTFIEARRICMERPFQDQWELLKVRGLSQETLQRWEAEKIVIEFDDPFLDYEKSRQESISGPSPARLSYVVPSPATGRPPLPSAAPSTAPSPSWSNHPTPSHSRPPLPSPRNFSDLPTPSHKKTYEAHQEKDRASPWASGGANSDSDMMWSTSSWNGGSPRQSPRMKIVDAHQERGRASPLASVGANLDSSIVWGTSMWDGDSRRSPDVEMLVELVYRQQDARLRRLALSRNVRTLSFATKSWRESVNERRRCDEVEFGIILRRLRALLKSTLNMWLSCVLMRSRLHQLGLSMLMRVLARYRAHAFHHWSAACSNLSAMGANYAHLLARHYTSCLAAHFEAWWQHTSRSNYYSRTVLRASSIWLLRHLKSAWTAWLEHCKAQQRLRSIGVKVLCKWLNVTMRCVLAAWREQTRLLGTVALMFTRNEHDRIAECFRRCWKHWIVLASFEAKLQLRKKSDTMRRDALSHAFASWHDHIVNIRQWAKSLSRAVAKLEMKLAYASFFRWNCLYRRNVELHEIGLHILVTGMNRKLRLIFSGWRHITCRSSLWLYIQEKVSKINKGMLYAQSFQAWRGLVTKASREESILMRIIYGWKTAVEQCVQLRRVSVKVLLRYLSQFMRSVFLRWVFVVGLARERAGHVKKVRTARLRSLQMFTLKYWRVFAREVRDTALATGNAVLQIGLRWTIAVLSAVFCQWREISKLMRSRAIHFARARRKLIWNRKRATMQVWAVYTYEARRLWHAGSVILSRWTNATMSSSFNSWMLSCAQSKATMAKMTLHLAKVCSRTMEFSFYAWQQVWYQSKIGKPPLHFVSTALSHFHELSISSTEAHELSVDSNNSPPTSRVPYPLDPSDSLQEDVDPWIPILSALTADQRMGLHMLGMKRTWALVSVTFGSWSSVRSWKKHINAAPPEPDCLPPSDLGPQRTPDGQNSGLYSRTLAFNDTQLTQSGRNRRFAAEGSDQSPDLRDSVLFDPQSMQYGSRRGGSYGSRQFAPEGDQQSSSTAAVVMSNYPRQQFSNSLSGEQEVDPSAPHPDSSMAANATAQKERSTPEALAGTPRSMLMSPQMVRSSKPFRDMLEEKTAKCGKPVMQSLSLGQPSCANDPEPKVYLL